MASAHIHVDMNNAAFEDNGLASELAKILRTLAERIEDGELPPLSLFDTNGNKVGVFDIDKDG